MSMLNGVARAHGRLVDVLRPVEGLGPLLLRLFLAPVMIQAGWTKFAAFEQTVAWFGNPDWGLGLPMPALWVVLAAGAELVGGVALVFGIGTRYFAAALAVTMLVAMWTVHWENGWLAISDASSWLANDRVLEAAERKARAIAILREHSNYGWLTQHGTITVLNNGIEFAATYLVMLISLMLTGGGKAVSVDAWLASRYASEPGQDQRRLEP